MLGVIGGTGLVDVGFLGDYGKKEVETEYGPAELLASDNIVFIARHDLSHSTPPHKVNNKANIKALEKQGVGGIVGISSTGSLSREIRPPAIVVPSDYINFWSISTFFDDEIVHVTPQLDEELRQKIIKAAEKARVDVHTKGVYVQTTGPRLETKAEVEALIKLGGDLVGMTMASEATLARELGIPYASICSVDNHAHGLSDKSLRSEDVAEEAARNSENIKRIILELAKQ